MRLAGGARTASLVVLVAAVRRKKRGQRRGLEEGRAILSPESLTSWPNQRGYVGAALVWKQVITCNFRIPRSAPKMQECRNAEMRTFAIRQFCSKTR